ncbi:glycosyltransferase [Rhodobacterales bacterium LSUCC0246]|nr:glycosyltransferase [Rhodobacterales bacterium LSUCC0374]
MTVRRIFHIQPGTDGGTERFCISLAQGFAERGIEQVFAIRPNRDWVGEVGRLGRVIEGRFLRRTPGGLIDAWRLRAAIEKFKPDAIVAWRAPSGRLIPRRNRAAKVVRLGDYPFHVRHLRGLDAVVCNNPSIDLHIRALGFEGRTEVISNFSRSVSSHAVSRSEYDTPGDAFLVCGVGRFKRFKGFDLLIDAVAQVDGAYLWLVGDGPEAENLLCQAEDLGIAGRVKFLGWQDDPTGFIAACDAYVLPSRDEALGNTLIEAWRVGVPSVASMTDGPNWYAKNGRDALLVPVGDAEAIAAALLRLVGDVGLQSRLVEGAHATLSQRFDRDAVLDGYLELFDGINAGRT